MTSPSEDLPSIASADAFSHWTRTDPVTDPLKLERVDIALEHFLRSAFGDDSRFIQRDTSHLIRSRNLTRQMMRRFLFHCDAGWAAVDGANETLTNALTTSERDRARLEAAVTREVEVYVREGQSEELQDRVGEFLGGLARIALIKEELRKTQCTYVAVRDARVVLVQVLDDIFTDRPSDEEALGVSPAYGPEEEGEEDEEDGRDAKRRRTA